MYLDGRTDRLLKLQFTNARQFWQALNSVAALGFADLENEILHTYFSELHQPPAFFSEELNSDIKEFMANYVNSDAYGEDLRREPELLRRVPTT